MLCCSRCCQRRSLLLLLLLISLSPLGLQGFWTITSPNTKRSYSVVVVGVGCCAQDTHTCKSTHTYSEEERSLLMAQTNCFAYLTDTAPYKRYYTQKHTQTHTQKHTHAHIHTHKHSEIFSKEFSIIFHLIFLFSQLNFTCNSPATFGFCVSLFLRFLLAVFHSPLKAQFSITITRTFWPDFAALI